MAKVPGWLTEAVALFGDQCAQKLAGPGDREAAIRSPLELLLTTTGEQMKVRAVFHDEVRDSARQVRPDYGVSVDGAITGYVEVKPPGSNLDPTRFTGHNKTQWERQRDLPNLLYTNGTEWRLYRDNEPLGDPVVLAGDLTTSGDTLTATPELELLLRDFLTWHPAPITSVGALVRAIAPLTRLLRGEVLDQLTTEKRAVRGGANRHDQPFTGLAKDWRALLFPSATDETFADGYAQTVTFALLLARTENITLDGRSLHAVGADLGADHSLMGKALQLLTDDVAADFRVTLDLLVRVIGAVQWPRVRRGRRDAYLHLYENFLEQYDNDLRKQSGSYYTPHEVVDEMVRFTEEVLTSRLGRADGFRDDAVVTVDPAMGTGTYLQTILERVAEQARDQDGPGGVAPTVTQVANRMYGFELQMGPYAVAELRAADLLASHGATPPVGGNHLYVTDTLDDPHAAHTQLASGLALIAASRRKANEVKAKANVTVVIGNPPYHERAEGLGGWVERGTATTGPILSDWHDPDTARHFHNLKNLYVYFWRWATWKVWQSTPENADDGDAGVICFITTSSYISGPGFTGMRRYLREYASEGWVIDLTPEGQTPPVPTRIFPGVRQPLAIGIFVRRTDTRRDEPATIHYTDVHGRRAEKFAQLSGLTLDGHTWQDARTAWTAPFTPAPTGNWDDLPALDDLFPWATPGVKGNRRWPYAPDTGTLTRRWQALQSEPDPAARATLMKETRDRDLQREFQPLPGQPNRPALGKDRGPHLEPVRVAFRAFDRQWLLPDGRLLDMARPTLWHDHPGQLFIVEQHNEHIDDGPGLLFTTLIPDTHFFNNRGGRVLPLLHPNGSPNIAPRLLEALTQHLGRTTDAEELLAYVAGLTAHPAFTRHFAEQLTTPGIRVPITSDLDLFAEVADLGRQVVWAQSYGAAFSGDDRPAGLVRYDKGDPRQPLALTPVQALPTDVTHDPGTRTVSLGGGTFGPVERAVWDYEVGGKNIIKSWVNYRTAVPGGRRTSPLDDIVATAWEPSWTGEFVDLLSVLTRLVELEPAQASALSRVLAGPVLTMSDLVAAGARWPLTKADRNPQLGLRQATADAPILDFE